MNARAAIGVAVGAALCAAALWQLCATAPLAPRARDEIARSDEGRPAAAPARPAPPLRREEARPVTAAPAMPATPERERGRGVREDPTGDLALYARQPMSAVPHRVVRGWGAHGAGRPPGAVAAFVVVDPDVGDAELAALIEDIRRYHSDATALSVRILDSERAATYDRHSDGGEFAAAHLVARISRNEMLGTDRVEIRGNVEDLAISGVR